MSSDVGEESHGALVWDCQLFHRGVHSSIKSECEEKSTALLPISVEFGWVISSQLSVKGCGSASTWRCGWPSSTSASASSASSASSTASGDRGGTTELYTRGWRWLCYRSRGG